MREAQIRSTFWSRRSLLTSGWVKRKVPRLRCLSGRQPRTATWPGCRVNIAASSRSVSSSWPSLTMNRCGAIEPAVRHGAEAVLDRAVVDLGDEPQRHARGTLLLGGHPAPAAGVLVVLAVGPVVAAQEQAGGGNRLAQAEQRVVAIGQADLRPIDLRRRRGVEDRLDVGRQRARDQADPQAVDLQRVADLGREHLLVGRVPEADVEGLVAEGTHQERHLKRATLRLDDLATRHRDASGCCRAAVPTC